MKRCILALTAALLIVIFGSVRLLEGRTSSAQRVLATQTIPRSYGTCKGGVGMARTLVFEAGDGTIHLWSIEGNRVILTISRN
jgi:hypothetical protein